MAQVESAQQGDALPLARPMDATGLLLSTVFSAPLVQGALWQIALLRAVHCTPENALYKAREQSRR